MNAPENLPEMLVHHQPEPQGPSSNERRGTKLKCRPILPSFQNIKMTDADLPDVRTPDGRT